MREGVLGLLLALLMLMAHLAIQVSRVLGIVGFVVTVYMLGKKFV